jgi:protein-disulfide isomerase
MRKTAALAFSLLGLFASTYLWWMYTSPSVPMVCMGQGCEVVRASRFAHVYGVPMPVFGVLMYITLILGLLAEPMVSARTGTLLRRAVVGISAAGFLSSLYLTALEAFVIHAFCMWCVVQAVSVTLVLLFAWRAPSGYESSDAALRGVRQQSATLLVAVIIGVPAFLFLQHKTKVPPAALPAVSEQSISEHLLRTDTHMLGDANAPVTVIEFGDLQCPSCAAANDITHELRKRFGSQMRFVFRHFPMPQLHQYALKAAEASECAAEQGRFWEAVDRFYRSEGKLDDASLRSYASELGLDVNRFNTCLASGSTAARVRRDAEDGRFLGVRSTPTFIVGRQMIEEVKKARNK